VLGELAAPGEPNVGAVEVAASADSRYAFVSLEDSEQIAVFDLVTAAAGGFSGNSGYVGAIPTQLAPVGLAVSPDGRWLYSTSEGESLQTEVGTLAIISVPRAESDPAAAVVARVPAGCNPVRVTTSANGTVVWVTARASDALLAFSASGLRADPGHALLADVRVGEAPVGLVLAEQGSIMIVADSDRFGESGQAASLAVVNVAHALQARPALVGYLPAGQFPRDLAASPSGSTVLVANYASGQLETVNLAALP
jgi:DNA-binding beta-propeller fold protein YncE